MSEQDIRAERLKKLQILKEAGMEAYPADSHRDTSNAQAVQAFDELESGGKKIRIGGRIMSKRGQGGIVFADIFDGTARFQIVLQKSGMIEIRSQSLFDLFSETADIGDFVEASGTVIKTKRG